ncbi:MAG: WbqC family protein [Bacteroidota bacterium]
MNQTESIFPTAYFPSLTYLTHALKHDILTLEAWENFPKQTFRNRCNILGPNGIQSLSIPTMKTADPKRLIRDVRISNEDRWQQIHWRSITSAYNKSPYFMYYRDELEPVFYKKHDYLLELNHEILKLILKFLKVDMEIQYTEIFTAIGSVSCDFRYVLSPKIPCSLIFPLYYQVFRDRYDFIPDLSILDLLFNLGPESKFYLKNINI